MVTLIIAFAVINIALLVLACHLDNQRIKRGKKKLFYTIWCFILAITAIFSFVYPVVQQNIAIGDAEQVAIFEEIKFYHDKKQDTYFTVRTSDWDIIHIIEKKTVENELAEEIVKNVATQKDVEKKNAEFYNKLK